MKGELIGHGRSAELFAWDGHQALKLFYLGWPFSVAQAEARAARQVYATGLRVPAVEDALEVEGRAGIIYERVEGVAMLDRIASQPWAVVHFAHLLAELHADMHSRRAVGLPSQRKYMVEQIQSVSSLADRKKKMILSILEELPDGEALCHGDYHPGNILLTAGRPMIIDWPLAAHGNPAADAARTSMLLSMGSVPSDTPGRWLMEIGRNLFHHFYLKRYTQLRDISAREIAAWQIPVMAARLAEGLEDETDDLLARLDRALPE
jgi:aminoglycoside phosphotransferase (APT) family kinase protein